VGTRGTGNVTLNGAAAQLTLNSGLKFGNSGTSGATGTVDLIAGTLKTTSIAKDGSNTGTFNFNGGTLQAGASSTSFMTGLTAANVKAGGAKIDSQNFDITIGQALAHDAALGSTADGGLTKIGAGTLTLAGNNTYTGTTTVSAGTLLLNSSISGSAALNINGGILQLGIAGALNQSAAVTLGGGTLATNGFSATIGKLTLGINSTIDFSNGPGNLTFGISDTPWASNQVLTITNWSNSSADGGADHIFFGSDASGLGGNLTAIQFQDPVGYAPGIYSAQMLGNELVAVVPEPGAWVSLLGGCGVLLGLRRRRC
jgi:autotransporter-associated beta strand protein